MDKYLYNENLSNKQDLDLNKGVISMNERSN